MKKYLLYALVLFYFPVIVDTDLSTAEPAAEIIISAAVSLKNAFEEIRKIFEEKHPQTKIRFNFGASGDLGRQIQAGAPVDVFASAAQKDMDDIPKKGLSNPRPE